VSRIPPQVIAEVDGRRAGSCEACGLPATAVEYHHRQARQMGGSRGRALDTAVNLLGLHRRCHAWAHAHPRQARERGLIVTSWADPAIVAVIAAPVPQV
jgi:hypothetical protein